MKCLFFAIALLVSIPGYHFFAQSNYSKTTTEQNSGINWVSWEEAVALNKIEKKKIFVDIYTQWCKWCSKMDDTTFANQEISQYMNEHFYAVKFDAEQKEPIVFKDKTYEYVSADEASIQEMAVEGYHELAFEITKGRLSYPTFVFIDENLEVIQPIPGFKKAEVFEMIMTYFGNNKHTSTPWAKYQEEYVPLVKRK